MDPNSVFSTNSSIAQKIGLTDIANKVSSGLGSISAAAQSLFKTSPLNIKSSFASTDFKSSALSSIAKNGQTPEEARRANGNYKYDTMVYPADIKYMTLFSFYKYERVTLDAPPKSIPIATIALPMPANLAEAFAVDYDTPALGPAVGAASNAVINAFRPGGGGIKGLTPASIADAGQKVAEVAGAVGMNALKSAPVGGETLFNLASIAAGVAPNPHLAVIFRNIGLREHSFSYKFAPNSKEEMILLKRIVKQFKHSMLPGMTQAAETLFTFPDTCKISFQPDETKPYKIKECVLASLNVNYAPGGSPAFFKTGDPTMVEISMTFKEISPFTRKDLPKDDKDTGDYGGSV